MASSEKELFEAVQAGAPGAWDRLVARYERLVYAVPRRMGLSPADSEEVGQATWISLHRHAAHIRKPRSLASWIITTATREAGKLNTRASRRREIEARNAIREPDEYHELPEEVAIRLERIQIVRDAIEELDPRCQALLNLLDLGSGETSYRDAAEELGMPLGSIGPIRLRCLARLASILEPSLID